MKNKLLIISTFLLFVIGIAGSIYSYFIGPFMPIGFFESPLEYFILNIAIYLAIYQLIKAGTITRTVYWRFVYSAISVIIIGALFKIQHWVIADYILGVGLGAIILIYIFRFLNKKQKKPFDYLKLLWVCSFFIIKALVFNKIISQEYSYISVLILIITYLYFVFAVKTSFPKYRNLSS
jgi:hypothetical protein